MVLSAAGLEPWKWQLLSSPAKAAGAKFKVTANTEIANKFFMVFLES
jgi:hypothetical protein